MGKNQKETEQFESEIIMRDRISYWIRYNSDVQGKVEFMYQVNSNFHYSSSKAALIGITDTKKITNGKVTKYNILDGAILTNSVFFY